MKIVNGLLAKEAERIGLVPVYKRDAENDILVLSYDDNAYGYRLSEILLYVVESLNLHKRSYPVKGGKG